MPSCYNFQDSVQYKLIVKNITRRISLSDAEINFFTQRLKWKKIRRKQYLLQADEVCRNYTFVNKGCLRFYGIDASGVEHVLQFAPEDYWVADIGSFYKETPTQFYIDALETSEILQINKSDLIATYEKYPRFDRVFRIMMENAFVGLQKRVLQDISSTAEERYLTFLEQYPQLVNRLPQTQIAAFIGITPEFLSKIRKNLTPRKTMSS